MAAEMNERRELVLKLVVQEFIENPLTPVASELLVRKYGMNVSSATIRNEMAALEDLGYLTHSHTSAGRVPTDAGYRYYVENLMERTPLSASACKIPSRKVICSSPPCEIDRTNTPSGRTPSKPGMRNPTGLAVSNAQCLSDVVTTSTSRARSARTNRRECQSPFPSSTKSAIFTGPNPRVG